MSSCNLQNLESVSIDFAQSDFFREIWQILIFYVDK